MFEIIQTLIEMNDEFGFGSLRQGQITIDLKRSNPKKGIWKGRVIAKVEGYNTGERDWSSNGRSVTFLNRRKKINNRFFPVV